MCLIIGAVSAHAQGTAFTYQGRLTENGSLYSGNAEFQATLWSVPSGGTVLASNSPPTVIVPVTNGLFVLPLDFGANFPGANRWLQLEVRTTVGPFTPLTPRQQLTATPYAITASNLAGTLPAAQLSGTVANARLSTNVSLLGASIDSAEIADGTIEVVDVRSNTFWQAAGNAGTTAGTHFLGTTDSAPLEIKVNGQRALRIEYATTTESSYGYSPNMVGGFPGNIISNGIVGAVIGGGGSSNYPNLVGDHFATVVGGYSNTASAVGSTASGGLYNTASGVASTAMGFITTASGFYSTAMGWRSTASGEASTAMGTSTASGDRSTAMGHLTTASGRWSTTMGALTTASADYSTAMGRAAKANHTGAFVCADSQPDDFVSTASDQFSVRARGGVRLAANVQIGTASGDYRQLQIGGGNSFGYLYGSFPAFGDGIHLGYNYYADAGGVNRVIHPGGATSRISAGYGYIGLGTGGVGAAPTSDQLVVGPTSVTVNGTFNNNSDRNAKQNVEPVNPAEILHKVIQLPLSEWSYKTDAATRHLGPMAQDFYSAFNVGTDDKHIAPIDEGGVALAAIQGLNEKVESGNRKAEMKIQKLETENAELKRKNAEMESRLSAMEKRITRLVRLEATDGE